MVVCPVRVRGWRLFDLAEIHGKAFFAEIGSDHLIQEIQRGIPEATSPIYYKGRLYLMRDGGLLTCLQASTGKEIFRESIGATGQYIASPIVTDDKLIVASVPGIVTVIQADDTLKVLARNKFNESIFATPAVVGNRIFLRTEGHLYGLGE